MKISVIIPNHRSEATLPETLRSVEAAAVGLDVETIVSEDPEGKGLSWARNQGLARATGDVVFFVDADDTVKPDYLRRMSSVLEEKEADFVISEVDYAPLKRNYDLSGNEAIRAALLPAFYGYSIEDIRRWNRGGDLMARREQGGVWRCAFRRAFIVDNHIRFNEELRVFEDSPFLALCACYARRVISIPDRLYDYRPGPHGILATYRKEGRYWPYKFAALRDRRAMATRAGIDFAAQFGGSVGLTVLEMMRHGRHEVFRYLREPGVREALAAFPVSRRHPLAAAGIFFARCV